MPQPDSSIAAAGPIGFDPFEVTRLRDELALLRFLDTVRSHLRNTRDAESALRFIVRAAKDHFDTSSACLTVTHGAAQPVQMLFAVPQEHIWPMPTLTALLRGEKTAMRPDTMFVRIRRRERLWGVLALHRVTGEFDKSQRQALGRVGSAISDVLREIDSQRIREVRDRIDRKIMSEVRPIDLSYQILDALRSLTGYDHSSAVLMYDGSGAALQIVAEQIAWRKAKSQHIGATLPVSKTLQNLLSSQTAYGFTRGNNGQWREWEGRSADELAQLLDYNRGDNPESQMLCAPITGRDGVVGVIKVSAIHADAFGAFEATLLNAFLPQVAIAVQNAQRAESLESKMIAAERKHAMADLARGVAHDLNNALGSVLPLVEQMRLEAESLSLDPKASIDDLRQIETSLQTCRRIFNGMLTFARRAGGGIGQGQVRYAIECAMAILGDNLRRRGINVTIDLAEPLPTISGGQSALEQLVLNLLTNARDAMPDGGQINISADRNADDLLRFVVEDNGCGIAPEHLPVVLEPFFTTKSAGSGLGLSICRSIVWDMGGKILFDSTVGKGTRVTLLLPVGE